MASNNNIEEQEFNLYHKMILYFSIFMTWAGFNDLLNYLFKKKFLLFSWERFPFFGIITFFFYLWFKSRSKNNQKPNEVDNIKNILKKIHRQRAIFSFGLIPLREKILDWLGIGLYGTFKRPSSEFGWLQDKKHFKRMDRLTPHKDNEQTIEYRYSKDFKTIGVRKSYEEEEGGSRKFSDDVNEISPSDLKFKEKMRLLFGSNIFPIWYFVCIVKRYCWIFLLFVLAVIISSLFCNDINQLYQQFVGLLK